MGLRGRSKAGPEHNASPQRARRFPAACRAFTRPSGHANSVNPFPAGAPAPPQRTTYPHVVRPFLVVCLAVLVVAAGCDEDETDRPAKDSAAAKHRLCELDLPAHVPPVRDLQRSGGVTCDKVEGLVVSTAYAGPVPPWRCHPTGQVLLPSRAVRLGWQVRCKRGSRQVVWSYPPGRGVTPQPG
jgi:hypothetical protein